MIQLRRGGRSEPSLITFDHLIPGPAQVVNWHILDMCRCRQDTERLKCGCAQPRPRPKCVMQYVPPLQPNDVVQEQARLLEPEVSFIVSVCAPYSSPYHFSRLSSVGAAEAEKC